MPTIHITDRAGKAHTVEVNNGLTLMEPLRELDDGIEALCGVPIDMISTGPERDETILRRHPFD